MNACLEKSTWYLPEQLKFLNMFTVLALCTYFLMQIPQCYTPSNVYLEYCYFKAVKKQANKNLSLRFL